MSEKQPTQAGKFKPRKPPKKKIAVPSEDSSKPFSGDSNDNVVAVESITQKVVSTRERCDGASSSGRGRGRDRGGGRGGRGGRRDVPKGTVFFTGDAAQVNSLKSGVAKSGNRVIERPVTNRTERPTNASSSSSEILRAGIKEKRADEVEEIIVGEIEGYDDPSSKRSLLADKKEYVGPSRFKNNDDNDDDETEEFDIEGPTYDSDSSEDASKPLNSFHNGRLRPQELPVDLPKSSFSPHSILPMYKCQLSKDMSEDDFAKISITEDSDSPLRRPFLTHGASFEEKSRESKSWMLFKFPTRIPAVEKPSTMAQNVTVKIEQTLDGDMNPQEVNANTDSNGEHNVSSSTFDDNFKHIPAGYYGKIVMYKSGKTFLVMGKDDNQIRMEITEGVQCGFYQQAVSINTKKGEYAPVGQVTRSLVVTPDIDGEFN